MQLIVEKYYYSWNVGEFLFYLTKPKFKPLKCQSSSICQKQTCWVALPHPPPFKWRPGHLPYLPYPRYATGIGTMIITSTIRRRHYTYGLQQLFMNVVLKLTLCEELRYLASIDILMWTLQFVLLYTFVIISKLLYWSKDGNADTCWLYFWNGEVEIIQIVKTKCQASLI